MATTTTAPAPEPTITSRDDLNRALKRLGTLRAKAAKAQRMRDDETAPISARYAKIIVPATAEADALEASVAEYCVANAGDLLAGQKGKSVVFPGAIIVFRTGTPSVTLTDPIGDVVERLTRANLCDLIRTREEIDKVALLRLFKPGDEIVPGLAVVCPPATVTIKTTA